MHTSVSPSATSLMSIIYYFACMEDERVTKVPRISCKLQNRGRLAEKRTIPLPPNRVPKKELASIFSSDDSEGSERASGDHAHIKQEDDLHYSIMRKR